MDFGVHIDNHSALNSLEVVGLLDACKNAIGDYFVSDGKKLCGQTLVSVLQKCRNVKED